MEALDEHDARRAPRTPWSSAKRPQDGRREVVAEITRRLERVTAPRPHPRCDRAERSPVADETRLPRQVRYFWSVEAPRLPSGAKELLRDVEEATRGDGTRATTMSRRAYDPPVFEYQGRRFVLIKKAERAPDARRLADELKATVVVP